MNFEHILVLCSCPDAATATRISAALVDEGLAACVSQIGDVRSTYAWEGRRVDDREVLIFVKTVAHRYPEVELRLKALHPYDVPEIIAVPIVAGSGSYLAWMAAATRPPGEADSQSAPQL